jgi:XTP/dITP diphosphohydrolase/ATP diphosphatase
MRADEVRGLAAGMEIEAWPDAREAGVRVAEAAGVMARLRGPEGCPWDREQTFDSIKRNTLEETYEVFDAIERRDWPDLKDELGDMLLQVLFYAQMASEAGYFSLADVAVGLTAKLVRRHPHVFGEARAKNAGEVHGIWDAVKAQEKVAAGIAPGGLMEQVSRAMPAMIEAWKLGAKAAKVGFDWPDVEGILGKLHEEVGELEAEVVCEAEDDAGSRERRGKIEDELGDVLFTAVNLARHLQVDPETALRRANAKFRGRFGAMERAAGKAGLEGRSAGKLEEMWVAAKRVTPEEAKTQVPSGNDRKKSKGKGSKDGLGEPESIGGVGR